jgi:hypothetical protein
VPRCPEITFAADHRPSPLPSVALFRRPIVGPAVATVLPVKERESRSVQIQTPCRWLDNLPTTSHELLHEKGRKALSHKRPKPVRGRDRPLSRSPDPDSHLARQAYSPLPRTRLRAGFPALLGRGSDPDGHRETPVRRQVSSQRLFFRRLAIPIQSFSRYSVYLESAVKCFSQPFHVLRYDKITSQTR